jgi:ATP-dependent helicase/nuclease subunit A
MPAITAAGHDVVVTAGAGAGKTRTLVARYLALLAGGLPLRSIVAITFTRKAAREMRNRLRDSIRRYLERPDLPSVEREAWAGHLTGLDAARVGTIHSLCADLLRAHPAEAGLDPRFEVLDEGQTRLLQQQAIADSLAWAATQTPLAHLFEQLGEQRLTETVSTLLKQRLAAEPLFATHPPRQALSHWHATLAARQAQARGELLAHPDWQAAAAILHGNAADKEDDKLNLLRQLALAALNDPNSGFARLGELKNINNRGSKKNWSGGPDQIANVRQALKTLKSLWQEQSKLLAAELNDLDQRTAALLSPLHQLFVYATERYQHAKQGQNSLDFDDLEALALALLHDYPTVRRRWQSEVRALLVDEFQDTNARQRDLLAWLNDNQGKLFIVGDAKQSIYRFRGADVAVFRQERQRIEADGGQSIPLYTSYRAHRELIRLMNGLLGPVLGTAADPVRPWLEPFAPLRHERENARPGIESPHIELHLAVGSKNDGALTQAAAMLVNRLVELIEASNSGLTYGDIAILCRSAKSFGEYENALEATGVPFLTVAGRGFYDRPEIRDLLNALRAIADPTDDLALAGLLRSPALALSDEALYRLRRRDEASGQRPGLWRVLQTPPAGLSPIDAQQAGRAVEIIRHLHHQVGRRPAADLLKQFLDESGYLAVLRHAGQQRSLRNVNKLLDDANAVGLVSVTELVAYLTGLRDSGSYEGEARTIDAEAVQLMTIHAAKGLEFPIVVIGDAGNSGNSRKEILFDPTWGILLPLRESLDEAAANDTRTSKKLPIIYELAHQVEQEKERAETKRLLYVAVTRAQEKVLFSGAVSAKQDGTLGKPRGWLNEVVDQDRTTWAAQSTETTSRFELTTNDGPVAGVIQPGEVAQRRVEPIFAPCTPSEVVLPPPLLGAIAVSPHEASSQRVSRVTPVAGQPRPSARVVGELTHRALAAWRFPNEAGRFDVWLAAQARAIGLPDTEQVAEVVARSRRLLTVFQQHPLYTAMSQAAVRLAEVPYHIELAGVPHSGRLDALFQQGELWTVVEYKTDRVRDEVERQQVLAQTDYTAQVERYRAVVAQFTGQQPVVILCWLNINGQVYLQTDEPAALAGN